jgi:hypothetical protein
MFWLLKKDKEKFRPGHVLPEPEYQTPTGRKLYTVSQIRDAYEQGMKDSKTLLVRSRNLLSHPQHWHGTEAHAEKRMTLSKEIANHLNGLAASKAWTEAGK